MRRRTVRSGTCDHGAVTVEAVIALPVLMLTILACTQIFLLLFARAVAHAAAQEGVRAARADHASRAAAGPVAHRYATRTADGFLTAINASSTTDATTVRVTVTGESMSLVPFLGSIPVREQAAGPLERFTTPRGATGQGGR